MAEEIKEVKVAVHGFLLPDPRRALPEVRALWRAGARGPPLQPAVQGLLPGSVREGDSRGA